MARAEGCEQMGGWYTSVWRGWGKKAGGVQMAVRRHCVTKDTCFADQRIPFAAPRRSRTPTTAALSSCPARTCLCTYCGPLYQRRVMYKVHRMRGSVTWAVNGECTIVVVPPRAHKGCGHNRAGEPTANRRRVHKRARGCEKVAGE